MRKVIGNPNVLNFLQRNKAKLFELRSYLHELDRKAGQRVKIVQDEDEALLSIFELIVLV
ncbi:hypothetical protein CsatB_027672 [Cannabis sativa]